ncbi:MAG: glycosyltransferase [Verrucomicrobiota bacterium]
MFERKNFPLTICVPVYNDWEAAANLLNGLNGALEQMKEKAAIVLVDDGSEDSLPPRQGHYENLPKVEVLRLRRNLGHQRAIAIGLSHIFSHYHCDATIVMDADGQDAPEDVNRLIQCCREQKGMKVIFAQRSKRAESLWFGFCYRTYKVLHWMLTGRRVEVGNFSIVPASALNRLMAVSELWNHYAASVFKAKIPTEQIPIPRAKRQKGHSQMNFVGLVMHGLSGMSVFGEEIVVRVFIFLILFVLILTTALGSFLLAQMQLHAEISRWVYIASGALLVAVMNTLILSLLFTFVILQRRSNADFLPLRDYSHYVMEIVSWHE